MLSNNGVLAYGNQHIETRDQDSANGHTDVVASIRGFDPAFDSAFHSGTNSIMTDDRETVLRPDEAVRLAMEMHRAGHLKQAEQLYRMTLEAAPEHPDALHWLGVLMYAVDRPEQGRILIERSVELVPNHPDFQNNLGNALQASEEFADAERAYRRCLELRPEQPQVWCNLGVCLRRLGRPQAAVAAYEKALSIDADQADVYHNLANLLQKQGKFSDAVQAYQESIDRGGHHDRTYQQLARLYYSSGRNEEAARVYRQWLEANPEHPLPRHFLAACTGEAVPERTSDEAVRQTFDGFAASFDKVLAGLDYRTPEVIWQQAQQVIASDGTAQDRQIDVLDIGCGTGLCGPLLRPSARTLTGVDLSPAMLEKAHARGVYDALHEAELVGWLEGQEHAFDLIVCADTLCYFGALDAVFAAARHALRRDGHFVFSVESADALTGVSDWRLHPHGRYAHRSDYVRDRLAAAGLQQVEMIDTALRRELGQSVAGVIFTAGRASGQSSGSPPEH